MRNIFTKSSGANIVLQAALLINGLIWGAAWGQDVVFKPLLNARSVTSLLEVGDRVFGGLDEGGLVVWDKQDLTTPARILAGEGLSGNRVSDMAWTERYVWVATRDGGLTRIGDTAGEMTFRQYSSNLGDTDLTAVTGTIIGASEWVFYAMDGAGVGRIIDGLPGNLYTAEQDGLINNNVNALQFFQGDLFVATPTGISRFANNVFTDQNQGLSNTLVNDLALAENGDLLAAGNGGVYRWDASSESWSSLSSVGHIVKRLASGPAGTFALGGSGVSLMSQYDGASWTTVALPFTRTYAVFSGEQLFVGGQIVESGMPSAVGYGWLGRLSAGGSFDTWRLEASLVRNANGVTFGADGSPWIGSHNADALSQLTAAGWNSIYQLATADNDSSGLFNHASNVLAMTTGTDGVVYAGQYTTGVVRHDPAAGRSDLMNPANCGLEGGWIVNMATHPAGPVIFMHDWANTEKVEVLVDPVHWRNPSSWLVLPTGEGGLGNGPTVWDAVAERNDVIWFAVDGTGLVRWDINGDAQGPNDPLTWLDTSDDRWDDPVVSLSGTSNDPTKALALALAPDGSIWAGGNGLVRFTYDQVLREATLQEHFSEKTSPFAEGLVNGNVEDLAIDRNGDLWVSSRSGLNRGITSDGETTFAAWFDLGNYLSNSSYGTLYSPSAIVSLPGGLYRKIAVDPSGRNILLSSDRGAVLVQPGEQVTEPVEDSLPSAYVFPNPFKPGDGQLLKLGGIDAESLITVQIYNLEGQLVYDCCDENEPVLAGTWSWRGRNIATARNNATTGMYLVKITLEGQTALRPLALLR